MMIKGVLLEMNHLAICCIDKEGEVEECRAKSMKSWDHEFPADFSALSFGVSSEFMNQELVIQLCIFTIFFILNLDSLTLHKLTNTELQRTEALQRLIVS